MMTQNADKKREQIQMFCMDDMVPQDHLLRIIDKAIDWNFIYELVVDKYSPDNGRPSMAPVTLIKLLFVQYLYGIRSIRRILGMKGLYSLRKETIERIFGVTNENPKFRYTDVWENPEGDGSGAYRCLHEYKKVGKNEGQKIDRTRFC